VVSRKGRGAVAPRSPRHQPARDGAPAYQWAALLADAVSTPGTVSRAYSAFWPYSLGNQLAAYVQCLGRGIELGPIATFPHWQQLGRQVRKGERALWLCQPVTYARAAEAPDAEADVYTRFVWRPRWFVLAQTDPIEGQQYAPPPVPGWDRARALAALQVREVPFTHPDGNAQGYSQPGRVLAINPVAAQPLQTTLHELGHIVLGHHDTHHDLPRPLMEVEAEAVAYLCAEALGLPGAAEARGYIQHYLARGAQLDEPTARRISKATDAILQAGRE
jgi:antirestriction protein ArdC